MKTILVNSQLCDVITALDSYLANTSSNHYHATPVNHYNSFN